MKLNEKQKAALMRKYDGVNQITFDNIESMIQCIDDALNKIDYGVLIHEFANEYGPIAGNIRLNDKEKYRLGVLTRRIIEAARKNGDL